MQVLDKGMVMVFAALSFASLRENSVYGIRALFNTVLLLAVKGNPNNMTRYVSVAFPTFIVLALWGERNRRLHQAVAVLFAVTLSLLMALWCQYYKVV
jgi:hypothetical protein